MALLEKRLEADNTPQQLLRMQAMQMTVLLANTPAKSLQHGLEQAAWGIGLYVNAEKNGVYEF